MYFTSARLRIFKFEGDDFQTGKDMNIIKEKTFDKNLYRVINESREFMRSQLREFTYLEDNGVFEKHDEYPEFAWYEGIVNTVTHRDYSNSGEQILVKIYNNRIEILSPGGLCGFVTLDTMKTKRYSINPIISRALVEFGIVRELNEGIKRIYREMKNSNLPEPLYTEPDRNSVLLVLRNNIEQKEKVKSIESNEKIMNVWNKLSYPEQKALEYIYNNGEAAREDIEKVINRGKTATITILNKLIEKDLITWTGTSKKDNYGKYICKTK